MNILVVDDEPVQIESLKRGLRTKGYTILGALSAEEALDQISDDKSVDMVLTDFDLKGMNGMELLRRIRENNASLPVIMTTAYGEKKLLIDALRNRCDSFIEKPFTLDQLTEEIERTRLNSIQRKISDGLSEQMKYLAHYLRNATVPYIMDDSSHAQYIDDMRKVVENLDSILESAPEAASDIEKVQMLVNAVSEVVLTIATQVDEVINRNTGIYRNVTLAARELQKFIESISFDSAITREVTSHLNEVYAKNIEQANKIAEGLFRLSDHFSELAKKYVDWDKPKRQ